MAAVAVVTGCAGFIGRPLVRRLLEDGHYVVGMDSLTYAARVEDLWTSHPNFKLIVQDIRQIEHLHHADVVFHLAAETHVSNSIDDSRRFIDTNVLGTYALLERIRGQRAHNRPTLIHVSTDEVYGDVPEEWSSTERDDLCPSSPYSASKASADMLVLAWQRTYDLKARVVRPSNCYGFGQYHEKLIPKTVRSAKLGKRMTVHGDGSQTRMWLSVADCVTALVRVWEGGQDGDIYNVPGNAEISVRSVVGRIHDLYARATGQRPQEPLWGCDRPGGDRRYRVDGAVLQRLGWAPQGAFLTDLTEIVEQEVGLGVRI